jgi:hypothetical protein
MDEGGAKSQPPKHLLVLLSAVAMDKGGARSRPPKRCLDRTRSGSRNVVRNKRSGENKVKKIIKSGTRWVR